MPSHHRPCGEPARRPPGDHPLGRRPDPDHQLCRDPRPRAPRRPAARARRHRARRPGGDARLEHLAASRSLVRHHRHRRDLPHGQSAPVSRPDRLDRQSRRGPRDDDRPHLRAAAGEARRPAADASSATSCSPTPRTCRRPRCATRCPTRNGSPRSTATSPGRSSTRTPPPASATPPAPPAIPRACVYSHRSNVLHAMATASRQCVGDLLPRRGAAGRADVPCQLLVARLLGADGRRRPGDAGREARRRLDLRAPRPTTG